METFGHVFNERIRWELYSMMVVYIYVGNCILWWWYADDMILELKMIFQWLVYDIWCLITYLMTYNVVNCLLWWWYTYCMILVLMMIFQWLVYDIWCFGNVFNIWKRLDTYLMNVYVGNRIEWWWYTYCMILVLMVLYLLYDDIHI